ncbi:MAG: uridine phosphorylase [Anaerolineales bacterium]|nr:uridine phosphorylase [Anaerolineales bacterium]
MTSETHLQYHLHLKPGDVGRYILLPGDPGRCELIASYFDAPHFVAQHREFTTYTGTLQGEMVSVTSTGIGCPSTAIAIEELIAVGADTFIRVGTSGAMQPHIRTGDVAIVSGAIRDEGTTRHYAPVEYPAIADLDVLIAMREGARHLKMPHHVGVAHSKDSFYGEFSPERMPVKDRLKQRWQAWIRCGAICSEMEAATIFILSSIYKKRAGGVMLMVELEEKEPETGLEKKDLEMRLNVNRAIQTAIEGLKILIKADKDNLEGVVSNDAHV